LFQFFLKSVLDIENKVKSDLDINSERKSNEIIRKILINSG